MDGALQAFASGAARLRAQIEAGPAPQEGLARGDTVLRRLSDVGGPELCASVIPLIVGHLLNPPPPPRFEPRGTLRRREDPGANP